MQTQRGCRVKTRACRHSLDGLAGCLEQALRQHNPSLEQPLIGGAKGGNGMRGSFLLRLIFSATGRSVLFVAESEHGSRLLSSNVLGVKVQRRVFHD